MKNAIIPIFYSCDDGFVKYTVVSLHSMIANASRDRKYVVHILNAGISDELRQTVEALGDECFEIRFVDVTKNLDSVSDKLPLRDYYSKTTYYRLYIAEMFPEYSKAIYIDSDTVVTGDISELYDTDTGDAYLGACHEQVMIQEDAFGTYVEKVIGIPRYNYFNAGILLINCDKFREHKVLKKFIELLGVYNFVVTQDEDYLNLICKDHVHWMDQRWNTEIFGTVPVPIEEAKLIHYIMASKPWHYEDCPYGDIFWKYAGETSVIRELRKVLEDYTDAQKQNDSAAAARLIKTAREETERKDNYLNLLNAKRDAKRVAIVKKIEQYEREGRFDEDVEDDPPGRMLMPDEIEYIRRGKTDRLKTMGAFKAARGFVKKLINDKELIIKEFRGIENFQALRSGAIITCNHFNAFDSFAIQLTYDAAKQKGRQFWRVIREGNYTSFTGFYGTLMRNCNTLPLSSNLTTMKKFYDAVDQLLQEGHFVLFYPEQSMWWNYRKPKPLKRGAYRFAVSNNVPVLPCFITMKDSDILGKDGFYVQEYTVHISPPIYPDTSLPRRAQSEDLMQKNYALWKEIYETEYQMPLTYTTGK
ncbi:MAG: 1-acyl-sn-glycerol-3-phosphate acyltransferase [Ruminococcus sp.]|nr:1-acyl-sn-glycerol-3-phosphate acyltransferase [Ruminococcus sp.]